MEIIANDQGNRITSLYVAFTNEELLIGVADKNRPQRQTTATAPFTM